MSVPVGVFDCSIIFRLGVEAKEMNLSITIDGLRLLVFWQGLCYYSPALGLKWIIERLISALASAGH